MVPPPGFFKELRALCDEHGMLLIADEVQVREIMRDCWTFRRAHFFSFFYCVVSSRRAAWAAPARCGP